MARRPRPACSASLPATGAAPIGRNTWFGAARTSGTRCRKRVDGLLDGLVVAHADAHQALLQRYAAAVPTPRCSRRRARHRPRCRDRSAAPRRVRGHRRGRCAPRRWACGGRCCRESSLRPPRSPSSSPPLATAIVLAAAILPRHHGHRTRSSPLGRSRCDPRHGRGRRHGPGPRRGARASRGSRSASRQAAAVATPSSGPASTRLRTSPRIELVTGATVQERSASGNIPPPRAVVPPVSPARR